MSIVEAMAYARFPSAYPDLAGARVLVAGICRGSGIDLARAFGEHASRVILGFAEHDDDMTAVEEIVAQSSPDVHSLHLAHGHPEPHLRLARAAVQIHGGLDAVITITHLAAGTAERASSLEAVEDIIAEALRPALLTTRFVAARMGLTRARGSILNVVRLATPAKPADRSLAIVATGVLQTMTRAEATAWADHGVRINAVAPDVMPPGSSRDWPPRYAHEPGIAALALYLASRKGAGLSGCVFDPGQTGEAPV